MSLSLSAAWPSRKTEKRFNISSKILEYKACYLTQCSNFAAHSNMKDNTLLLQYNTCRNISPKHSNTELREKKDLFALIKNWSLANRNNVPLLSTVVLRDRNECACWFSPASRFNTLSWRWMLLLRIVKRSPACRTSSFVLFFWGLYFLFFFYYTAVEMNKLQINQHTRSHPVVSELLSWSHGGKEERNHCCIEDIQMYQTPSGTLQEASPSISDLMLSITQNQFWFRS